MKKYKFTINGVKYETKIVKYKGTSAIVNVNGVDISIEIEPQKIDSAPKLIRNVKKPTVKVQTPKISSPNAGDIVAPIPGVVIKIIVKEGDFVTEGDSIMILEAMKMESEINANASGRVIAIKVREGDAVQEDQALMEIGE